LNNDGIDNTSAGYVSGKVGSEAKDFDGNDDFVDLGKGVVEGCSEFTVSAWIYPESNSDFNRILANDNNNVLQFNLDDGRGVTLGVSFDGSWNRVRAGVKAPLEEWSLVTGVYNGSEIVLYLDGSQIASKSIGSGTLNTPNDNTFVGANNGNNSPDGRYFDGQIDDLHIYDRALSQPEIKELYERISTQEIADKDRLTSGLVGHWPLNEDSAGKAYDLSGRGFDSSSVTGTSTAVSLGGAKARRFNGSDEFIEIGETVLNISSDFSVNFWVNPRNISSSEEDQLLMENGRDVTSTVTNGEVRFRVYDGSNNYSSHYSISEGEWVMLTATWDYSESELKFYKNAVNSPAGSNGANGNADHVGFRLGDHLSSGYGSYDGRMADLRAYNRVLSKSEIKTLAKMGGL